MDERKINECKRTWGNKLSKLRSFLRNHLRYPKICTLYKENSLALWLNVVQMMYAEGRLSVKKIDQMNSLPGWEWNTMTDWEHEYGEYVNFVVYHGFHPEFSEIDNPETNLYKWRIRNIQRYKNKKLEEKNIRILEGIPGWEWKKYSDWDSQYQKVSKYLVKYGSYPRSPGNRTNYELKLANWVSTQKSVLVQHTLSQERKAKLELLQYWKWDKIPNYLDFYTANKTNVLHRPGDINQGNMIISDDRTDEEVTREIMNWYSKLLDKYNNNRLNTWCLSILSPWIPEDN